MQNLSSQSLARSASTHQPVVMCIEHWTVCPEFITLCRLRSIWPSVYRQLHVKNENKIRFLFINADCEIASSIHERFAWLRNPSFFDVAWKKESKELKCNWQLDSNLTLCVRCAYFEVLEQEWQFMRQFYSWPWTRTSNSISTESLRLWSNFKRK